MSIDEKEIKRWYDKKHLIKDENAWRSYNAYSVFLDYLEVKQGKKLLDIGCGTGYLLKQANKRGLKTYGVDISDEAVKIAKRISPNSKINAGKGENLNFSDNFFDYITCIGVLEHYLDIEKGVKEIKRVGKDDALFCIVVPNINYLFWKIKKRKGTEQQDINENLLSLKQWKNIFLDNGFKIINIYQDRWFMKKNNIFSSMNLAMIIKMFVFKLISVFLPLKYTYQFAFILRKKQIFDGG
jgi:2-polyprenyl-3-methyl-5-hydroxy-6-metoxy-1,4-benzoquinol methylase